jgi:two-component system nitrogen regulation response regulator NtrX
MPLKTFTNKALDELQKNSWTGNIRELRNVVERLLILCEGSITDKDVQQFANYSK